nr:helix-turn-helix transcriptional regulator [Kibdelosporangium sp. MJ126-NF4]CEL21810.1 putative DNA-binding protein [Kibdelosporangium sp. MJ126-NF4]CTQ92590.1 putative DNA-binding protein [Kibdelosporangium sp. MJ126-NF4]
MDDRPGQLGEFLHALRSGTEPPRADLRGGPRRRVPGLRREELAHLAGVSPSYYTRLEQGHSRGASREVLDSIADALDLGDDEREHLHRLATTPVRPRPARRRAEHVHPATRDLLTLMTDVPAIVQGRYTDILAWNRLGHALLAGHLDPAAPENPRSRPIMARLVFTDEHTRDLYADLPRKRAAITASLRQAAGRFPQDPQLTALIGQLSTESKEFAKLWAANRIRACDAAEYELRHPLVGRISVTQQALDIARSPEQTLITMTATPNSRSHDALTLLARSLR